MLSAACAFLINLIVRKPRIVTASIQMLPAARAFLIEPYRPKVPVSLPTSIQMLPAARAFLINLIVRKPRIVTASIQMLPAARAFSTNLARFTLAWTLMEVFSSSLALYYPLSFSPTWLFSVRCVTCLASAVRFASCSRLGLLIQHGLSLLLLIASSLASPLASPLALPEPLAFATTLFPPSGDLPP